MAGPGPGHAGWEVGRPAALEAPARWGMELEARELVGGGGLYDATPVAPRAWAQRVRRVRSEATWAEALEAGPAVAGLGGTLAPRLTGSRSSDRLAKL